MKPQKLSAFCPVFVTEEGQRISVCSPEVLIGRGEACHVQVQNEVVSTLHARVILSDSGFVIEDHQSLNGLYVDGKRVKRIPLKRGQRFRLGQDGPFLTFDLEPVPKTVTLRALPPGRSRARAAWALGTGLVLLLSVLIFSLANRRSPLPLAVALMAIEDQGRLTPVGSGFSVSDSGWLATTAHVAQVLLRSGDEAVVVPNSRPNERCPVLQILIPEAYRSGEFKADVALVRIADSGLPSLKLSDRRPGQGERLTTAGYPENAVNLASPRASALGGMVSRNENDLFFQINLTTSPGLSGSPLMDQEARCVGMVVGENPMVSSGGGSPLGWAIGSRALMEFMKEQDIR